MTSTNEREDQELEFTAKPRVFHFQPLLKDWVKLYNPQASYFTDLLL
jgi:hypothetical protein